MTSLPILLPEGYTPTISEGDVVAIGQVLAKKSINSDIAVINIAQELGLTPDKTGSAIKKKPGDLIGPGDIIASRKGFLGMGEQKVVSSVSGTITGYERRNGELTVQIGEATEGEIELLSPVDGTIKVCDNEKIVIATEKDSYVPEKGVGSSIQAEIIVLRHDTDTPVPLHLLTPEIIGKVIVVRSIDRDGILKAIGMETGGIIVNTLPEEDMNYLLDKNMKLPLVQLISEDFDKLTKQEGKQIFIDGEKKNVVLLHV